MGCNGICDSTDARVLRWGFTFRANVLPVSSYKLLSAKTTEHTMVRTYKQFGLFTPTRAQTLTQRGNATQGEDWPLAPLMHAVGQGKEDVVAALLAAWDVNSAGGAAGLAQIAELASGIGFPGMAAFLAAVTLHSLLATLGFDPAAPNPDGG